MADTIKFDMRVEGVEKTKEVWSQVIAVDPASIAANTLGSVDVTVAGMVTSDEVIGVVPPYDLEAGLIYKGAVAGTGVISIGLENITASPIDGASKNWHILFHKRG